MPFQPGGLIQQAAADRESKDSSSNLHRNEYGLFDVPPGFQRGLEVGSEKADRLDIEELNDDGTVEDKEEKSITMKQHTLDDDNDDVSSHKVITSDAPKADIPFDTKEIEGLVPFDYSSFKYDDRKNPLDKRTWAHVVDLDHKIEDFHELVPNMARTWPFELDTFRKKPCFTWNKEIQYLLLPILQQVRQLLPSMRLPWRIET